jgi:hypothetical protein
MKEREKSGAPQDEAFQKQIFELLDGMLHLDAGQLKVLVSELRGTAGIDDDMRRGIVGLAITMLANDHPPAALALFTESSDLFGGKNQGDHVIATALSSWAKDDPMAALEWVRKHSDEHPDLVTEAAKRGILAGAAKQDPKLAFRLIGELGLKDLNRVGDEIGKSAGTPAERDAVLAALRVHLKANPEPTESSPLLASTLKSLGNQAMADGFDSAAAWLDGAGLDEAETKAFTDSLHPWQTKGDTGKWIDWMAGKVPADQLSAKVGQLLGQWTREDYKSAGLWLDGAAEGPAKQAAVKTYAATVAPYDPDAAALWARTLPAGEEREELLRGIAEAKKAALEKDLEWTDPD